MITLLIVTLGQTDVQFVEGEKRKEFDRNHCAELHTALEQRAGDWRIVDAPSLKQAPEVSDLPEGVFEICTPKLDAVFALLDREGVTVTHALVLDTQRDPTAEGKDPHMAGQILARRICERAVLPGSRVRRVSYLCGRDRLEDRSDPRDAVIQRHVVRRIDEAIAQSINEVKPSEIIVATTGGLPVVCTLVEEVVRLHARNGIKVEPVEVADGAKADPPTVDQAVWRQWVLEPAASYQARRHALELIEQGNFIAAWGAVRHLRDDTIERRWIRGVEWLYCFAASLPLPDDCDIDLLRHRHRAVRAALRVELALRAGDIPRAVHGTVAFFEAALWDHLDKHVDPHPERQRLFKLEPQPEADLLRRSEGTNEDRRRPFEIVEVEGEHWYRIYDDDVCGVRLAKYYLKLDGLMKLGQAVSDVRELRNDVAHNEPTPALMQDAQRRMVDVGLWSHDAMPQFLTQALVQNAFKELGEEHPNCLHDDLMVTVRKRLVEFSHD